MSRIYLEFTGDVNVKKSGEPETCIIFYILTSETIFTFSKSFVFQY